MKYQTNPVIVDAFIILENKGLDVGGKTHLSSDNGEQVLADEGMTSRYAPKAGDYWVIQSDGYVYLNPKDVFERKYSPVPTILTAETPLVGDY